MSSNQRPAQAGKGRPTPKQSRRGSERASATHSTSRRSTTGPVYRSRRHAPLPVAIKAGLVVVWIVALAATIALVDPWTGRIGVMIMVTMALVLLVVLVFNPARRKKR